MAASRSTSVMPAVVSADSRSRSSSVIISSSIAGAVALALSRTFVPQPDGSISTVPLARSPSQATVVSGTRRVIRISPNSPSRLASVSGLLRSAHSSGGDLTSVR